MRALLLALAVTLAGCPAVGPGATPTPGEYPPGVTADGVTDPAALADAHADRVENTSYTLVSNRTVRYANGTVASGLFVRVELAADREFLVTAATAGSHGPEFLGEPPSSGEFWSNGSVYVRALTREGGTTYNQFTPPDSYVGTWRYWRATVAFGGQDGHARETVRNVFTDVPTEVTGVRTVDGTAVYTVEGEGATDSEFAKASNGPVGNVTLEAEVTEAGVLRRMDLSYVTFLDGESVRVDWTVRYADVGATAVDRPPWFDRAVAGNATVTTE
jgi:hypothetical protein